MDGWMDGQIHRQIDIENQINRYRSIQIDIDIQMIEGQILIDRQMDRYRYRQIDRWIDRETDGWIDRYTQMNGRMDGQIDRYSEMDTDEWKDGWMDSKDNEEFQYLMQNALWDVKHKIGRAHV